MLNISNLIVFNLIFEYIVSMVKTFVNYIKLLPAPLVNRDLLMSDKLYIGNQ